MAKRKQFSKEIKAKGSMEAIKGHRSINEISAEMSSNPLPGGQKRTLFHSFPFFSYAACME
ncbi:MAG: hypothetical protein U9P80_07655 [Thermodesulfobacteriota bacterium]|nr:hypothetical protein [Thermodesulfobacteriota bacterium]